MSIASQSAPAPLLPCRLRRRSMTSVTSGIGIGIADPATAAGVRPDYRRAEDMPPALGRSDRYKTVHGGELTVALVAMNLFPARRPRRLLIAVMAQTAPHAQKLGTTHVRSRRVFQSPHSDLRARYSESPSTFKGHQQPSTSPVENRAAGESGVRWLRTLERHVAR